MSKIDHFSSRSNFTNSQSKLLVHFAHTDSTVQSFTHDEIRFADLKTVKTWSTERFLAIFSPKGKTDELAAFVWFSHEAAPLPEISASSTMGVRVYPPFRGKSLAREFYKKAFKLAKKSGYLPQKQQLWLRVHKDNLAGLALYRKLGFREIKRELNQIYMQMQLS